MGALRGKGHSSPRHQSVLGDDKLGFVAGITGDAHNSRDTAFLQEKLPKKGSDDDLAAGAGRMEDKESESERVAVRSVMEKERQGEADLLHEGKDEDEDLKVWRDLAVMEAGAEGNEDVTTAVLLPGDVTSNSLEHGVAEGKFEAWGERKTGGEFVAEDYNGEEEDHKHGVDHAEWSAEMAHGLNSSGATALGATESASVAHLKGATGVAEGANGVLSGRSKGKKKSTSRETGQGGDLWHHLVSDGLVQKWHLWQERQQTRRAASKVGNDVAGKTEVSQEGRLARKLVEGNKEGDSEEEREGGVAVTSVGKGRVLLRREFPIHGEVDGSREARLVEEGFSEEEEEDRKAVDVHRADAIFSQMRSMLDNERLAQAETQRTYEQGKHLAGDRAMEMTSQSRHRRGSGQGRVGQGREDQSREFPGRADMGQFERAARKARIASNMVPQRVAAGAATAGSAALAGGRGAFRKGRPKTGSRDIPSLEARKEKARQAGVFLDQWKIEHPWPPTNTVSRNMDALVWEPARNREMFPEGGVGEGRAVVVLYVHNRPAYLEMTLEGLSTVEGIQDTLLVVSHDGFYPEMDALVKAITFCQVKQIYAPWSPHNFPNAFPGSEPNDCAEDHKPRQGEGGGEAIPCVGQADQYGHYRNPRFTSLKHHWWWLMNTVWDGLPETRGFNGHVIFLEEDHVAFPNALTTLSALVEMQRQQGVCPACLMLNLAPTNPKSHGDTDGRTLVTERMGNVGYAFNRSVWEMLHRQTETFCTFDEYNWDLTLWSAVQQQLGFSLQTLRSSRASAWHIGKCGLHAGAEHKKGAQLNIQELLQRQQQQQHSSGHSLNRKLGSRGQRTQEIGAMRDAGNVGERADRWTLRRRRRLLAEGRTQDWEEPQRQAHSQTLRLRREEGDLLVDLNRQVDRDWTTLGRLVQKRRLLQRDGSAQGCSSSGVSKPAPTPVDWQAPRWDASTPVVASHSKEYGPSFTGWGGWGDWRDQELCRYFGEMYRKGSSSGRR
eukprot:TRINITY_DN12279_c0_g2_i1.p1 TRINITY_DN12279_c0_g2~~TRINITY_DN12279_c0_g2_i1.p1  ORF type:complete len:1030 (-),score=179.89 TRINITY_DN12279_c0_g2_i1:681-3689(-)